MQLKTCLEMIVAKPRLHAMFVNTLSYLENCGAKLIAGSEHPTMVPKEILKHAAEEFRHAYFFKSQLKKITAVHLTYCCHELLGGIGAKNYLWRLNLRTAKMLRNKEVSTKQSKHWSYLLVTYAIEKRAEKFYPLYQEVLQQKFPEISIRGIIRDERSHLKEIEEELFCCDAKYLRCEVCDVERHLYQNWLRRICEQINFSSCYK